MVFYLILDEKVGGKRQNQKCIVVEPFSHICLRKMGFFLLAPNKKFPEFLSFFLSFYNLKSPISKASLLICPNLKFQKNHSYHIIKRKMWKKFNKGLLMRPKSLEKMSMSKISWFIGFSQTSVCGWRSLLTNLLFSNPNDFMIIGLWDHFPFNIPC